MEVGSFHTIELSNFHYILYTTTVQIRHDYDFFDVVFIFLIDAAYKTEHKIVQRHVSKMYRFYKVA